MSDATVESWTEVPATLVRLIADSVPALIAYFDADGLRCRFANQRYADYHGCTPESMLGKTVRDIVGEVGWGFISPFLAEGLRTAQPQNYEREQTLPNGHRRWINVHLVPHLEASRVIGFFVLINDITAQRQAAQAVRDAGVRLQKFFEAMAEGIVVHKEGVISDTNAAVQHLTGYSGAELQGMLTTDLMAPELRHITQAYLAAGKEEPYETELLTRDGRRVPVEVVGKTMPDEGGSYRVAVVRDISRHKQAQARIEFLALHDVLTQLPNRNYLAEFLPRVMAQARRQNHLVALLFVDLDGFKPVNDTFGHDAGDALLQEVARRMQTLVRESDLVVRLGGDEFLMLLTGIAAPASAERVANALITALAEPVLFNGHTLRVSPSIGVGLYPDHGDTVDALIKHADEAMYRSKKAGGNCYRY